MCIRDRLDDLAFGTAMDMVDSAADVPAAPDSLDSATRQLTVQYQTFNDLRIYCYGVASVVGLVCIHIFGYRDPAAEPLAEQCGLAFQLTNIIRDVKEDAAMGRVYLPEEDLAKFGLSAAELLNKPTVARFRPLLELEANRAREGYQAGDQLIPYISEDSQPALYVLCLLYTSAPSSSTAKMKFLTASVLSTALMVFLPRCVSTVPAAVCASSMPPARS